MAAYFQMFPLGSTDAESFQDIDDKMCAHFGVPPDPKWYYKGWYDTIGFALAMGKSWDWMREHYSEGLHPVIEYLETRYRAENWYGR